MCKSSRRKQEKVLATGIGSFLDLKPEALSMKGKSDKLDLIKLKITSLKDTVKRMRNKVTDWKKIFTNHISDKGAVSTM